MSKILVAMLVSVAAPAYGGVSFDEDVRPILSDNCFHCHGPDEKDQKAGLRLDTREGATADNDGVRALVPGDLAKSELWYRITTDDEGEVMPPPKAKIGTLSAEEKAIIRQWIEEGGEYEGHWAFEPVGEVDGGGIDEFVKRGLGERGLEMQPEAPKERLIRRVTFDLTGLPPTEAEIDVFLKDDEPGAYGRLVDRLLASPRYGERMAVDWLDLARYADTYGFQVDRDRAVWPWRDWVVEAFNKNLPYDDFVTWQLAGDLLENPTDEQVLATAFNRLHQQKVEGGSTEEEFRVEYVADRVHTFGTAFLGLSMECARCHDHKFDPVMQKDYYSLFAFFQNIDEAGLYSYFTPSVPTPTLMMMDDGKKAELAKLDSEVAALEKAGEAIEKVTGGGEMGWFRFDEKEQDKVNVGGRNELVEGKHGKAVKLTGDDAVTLPFGNFARWEPFSVGLWLKTPDVKERAVVFHRSRAWTDAASRGFEMLIEDGRLKWSLIHFWPGNAVSVKATSALPVGEWLHVVVSSDGSGRADGLKIYVGGEAAETEVVRDALTKQIRGGGGDKISIGERMRDRGFKGGLVDDFRVFGREVSAGEARKLAAGEVLDGEMGEVYAAHLEALKEARKKRAGLLDGVTEIMAMKEMGQPKKAYVLERGLYDARGEEVEMAVPGFLPPLPEGAPVNRLGLARWLTDESHPLFARTAVNRFWAGFFGRGLVKTAEDFGVQGERPEYRELVDWLAGDFMRNGWDVKRLMRQIAMSETYRQKSVGAERLMEDDPENRLLARGPRHRLSAEMIRDNALAASGLLVEKMGGAPVKPYEVAESFKPTKVDQGEGRYRRSLYTYWKQTAPAPGMMAFDAVKRDVCVARRERTNTPLQALILLNGDQYVEAARTLGEKLWNESGGDVGKLTEKAFVRLTSRKPVAEEVAVVGRMFAEQKKANGGDAVKAAGEVVLALMSFDECVVKR